VILGVCHLDAERDGASFPFFPFLKERVFQTGNVSMSACPTNQKAAFLNERENVDFRSKTEWQ
jgi:hypothetical protein